MPGTNEPNTKKSVTGKPVTHEHVEGWRITRFYVKHLARNEDAHRACIHFITYGTSYGSVHVPECPIVLELDLSNHQPPSANLCAEYDGQHTKLAKAFFSISANQKTYERALEELYWQMERLTKGECVACLINCTAGRHRSVAMAERLAEQVRRWVGFRAECLHLDLGKFVKREIVDMGEVDARERPEDTQIRSEEVPARGRRRSTHDAQATSEARVSDMWPRRAAARPETVIPLSKAPLRKKVVSWGATLPAREQHSRQCEIAGRSAGPWRQDENQSRRFSS